MTLASESNKNNDKFWLVYFMDKQPFYSFQFDKPVDLTTKIYYDDLMIQSNPEISPCFDRVEAVTMNQNEFNELTTDYSLRPEEEDFYG